LSNSSRGTQFSCTNIFSSRINQDFDNELTSYKEVNSLTVSPDTFGTLPIEFEKFVNVYTAEYRI